MTTSTALAARRPSATVVGGGPAGLIAAEVLARGGAAVTLYEHKPSVGRKLLLAGRSGLNLTHSEPIDDFVHRYGTISPVLDTAIRRFTPDDLRDWAADLGEASFVGSSGRVFPDSYRATPLLRAWLRRLDELGVQIATRHRWLGWGSDARSLRFRGASDGDVEVRSDVSVFALGGGSWPRVGSDGGWVDAFVGAGIAVVPLRPANCGLRLDWSDEFSSRFEGSPLKDVVVTSGERSVRGDPVVTRSGLEGGPIYTLASGVRDQFDNDEDATLVIDLRPGLDHAGVVARLARRRPKDSTSTWLRRALGLQPVAVGLMREATANRLPVDIAEMATLVKSLQIDVTGTEPIDRAISTAGGVVMSEVGDGFMLHRLPGTYLAGEMLDWDAPTGGYLLQACFSTGVAAGRAASERLAADKMA